MTQKQQVRELKNSWRRSENWDNINRNIQSEPNQRGLGSNYPASSTHISLWVTTLVCQLHWPNSSHKKKPKPNKLLLQINHSDDFSFLCHFSACSPILLPSSVIFKNKINFPLNQSFSDCINRTDVHPNNLNVSHR